MNDEIMVSILCAVYNHEKYLRQCLDGFVMQKTNFKFEVLIHDDASKDNSAIIIREYEEKYPDIIKPIYQTENQYSKGIKVTPTYQYPRAKGKYIAWCEGDDYWCDPYKLQKQFDALENNPNCKFCVHKVEGFDSVSEKTIRYYPKNEYDTGIIASSNFISQVLTNYSFQTSCFFGDKDYILKMSNEEFVKISPVGDQAISLFFGANSDIYYINEVMSKYRLASEQSWTVRQAKNPKSKLNNAKRMKKMLDSFDTYTNGKHHEMCEKMKKYYDYDIACIENDAHSMIKNKERFKKEGWKTKAICYLFLVFPFLKKLWR